MILLIGLMILFFFVNLGKDDDKPEEGKTAAKEIENPCPSGSQLIGNGICEKHIMNRWDCQYDQEDCQLNDEKEEIAGVICDAIQHELSGGSRCTVCHFYRQKRKLFFVSK